MSKFTVIGATGVIGKRLVSHLIAEGHDVFAPQRGDETLFSADLGNVIYAAGITANFRTRQFDAVEAHVTFPTKILSYANFSSFLYLSSTRVYAKSDSGKETAILKYDVSDSSDLYNISKLTGEALCREYSDLAKVVRLSNVVGGDDSEDSNNFVPALRREASSGKVVLRSALSTQKDYVHIDDVVTILPKILLNGRHQIYNVASGTQTTHKAWAEYFSKKTNCLIEVIPDAPDLSFPPIDITRIKTEFQFSPRSIFDI